MLHTLYFGTANETARLGEFEVNDKIRKVLTSVTGNVWNSYEPQKREERNAKQSGRVATWDKRYDQALGGA